MHNKLFLGAIVLLTSLSPLNATYVQEVAEKRVQLCTKNLFTEQKHPTTSLMQLLRKTGMDVQANDDLSTINAWSQTHLMRTGERWHEQTKRFDALAPELTALLADLGFTQEYLPTRSHYQGALVHGALLTRVRERIASLVDQWQHGVRFSHLYLLSGARPLEPAYENQKTFCSDETSSLKIRADWTPPSVFPSIESEMMLFVWNQAHLPKEMREQVQVHVINSPMKWDPVSSSMKRPTTQDTIEYWLKATPPSGLYLAITNAPYIVRQNLITQTMLPEEIEVESIGTKASSKEKIVILLDELARTIFYLQQFSSL